MMHDDSLANKLNGNRNEEVNPPIVAQHQQQSQQPKKVFNVDYARMQFFYDIYKTAGNQISVLIAAFLYGIAFSALFSLDWTLLQCWGVGLVLNHLIVFLLNIAKKIKLPKGPVIKE